MMPVLRAVQYRHRVLAGLSRGLVLDVGFAQAPNSFLVGPYGLDIQEVPKPLNYAEVKVANLNRIGFPYPSNFFSTVILGDVIEHVENPSFVLREVNRVLRADGVVLVSTPHACYYWTVLDDHLLRNIVKDPDRGEHLQNWTRRDMTRLLKKNGFALKKIHGGGALLPFVHLMIPNKAMPSTGYIVIYQATKTSAPDQSVITDKAYYGEGVTL